jgi:hypothetical protein
MSLRSENGFFLRNVFIVSAIMIETQMQTRYPVSNLTANGVRRCRVICVDDAPSKS